VIKKFINDMIRRGEAALEKSSLPPGKVMEYRPDASCCCDGVWISRDTQTGEEKEVGPGEITRVVIDGKEVE